MRQFITVIVVIGLLSGLIFAQQTDQQRQPKQEPSKVYWGGELSLSFGNYFHIGIIPMVGYKVTPQFHLGGKIGYSYTEDKRYEVKLTSHNYGGSIFSRYLIVRGLYAHAEFLYWSYQYQTEQLEGERTWVPFVLLGGGYIQPISPGVSLFVEVLWDVLRDENSPYGASDPFIKVGVGVGL